MSGVYAYITATVCTGLLNGSPTYRRTYRHELFGCNFDIFYHLNVPSKLIDFLKTVKRTSVYVLTKANGGIMTETAWCALWESYLIDLSRKYGKYIEKRSKFDPRGNVLMIEPFTPHCLRHTFCTLMYKAGIDALTAKEQMGHSDIKTTLSIYTHLDQKYKNKNICKLDDYLSKIG